MITENTIAWLVISVLGVVALIALVIGAVRGYTRLKPNGLVWVLACGLFLILEVSLVKSGTLAKLPIFSKATTNVANFIIAIAVVLVTTFALFGLFALIAKLATHSFNKKLKKAEKIKENEERGDDPIEIDANEEYSPLPINGKKAPRIINRIFGALTAMVNALCVAISILGVVSFVLLSTPLASSEVLVGLYGESFLAPVWGFLSKHLLDFFAIAFVLFMLRKGWEVGFLEGVRRIIAFAGYTTAVVGPFVIMFMPKVTGAGAPLAFLGKFAGWLNSLLSSFIIPIVSVPMAKIAVAIVLAVLLFFVMLGINWFMKKAVDFIDDVKVLSGVEKSLATTLYFVFAIALIFAFMTVMYVLEHYGVFSYSNYFSSESTIMNGFYGAGDQWVKPLLETITEIFSGTTAV